MVDSSFWSSDDKDTVLLSLKKLKAVLNPWTDLFERFSDLQDFVSLIESEQGEEEELFSDLIKEYKVLEGLLYQEEIKLFLSNEEDFFDVFLCINAGAGGRESCDWAGMLLRMYQRWAERRSFQTKVVDVLSGEDAGVKNVILSIRGEYAYGYLKSEKGVHRLVRISPFDSNKRRHTSFASVDIIPQLDDKVEIDINENDLRIDTYRAGGAGGQHVNKTDSAVRIMHIPTGIVVQCQNERSQHKNKSSALKMLQSKLYERELSERRKKNEQSYSEKNDIAWGSQIRSYVYHPYSMVKDHRIDYQTGNIIAFMDGELDPFIEKYLKTSNKLRKRKGR